MKLKFFFTIIIVLFMALTLSSSTYAFFSDSETSESNTFSAGTLQTETGYDASNPFIGELSFKEDIEFTFDISNAGSLETINNLTLSKLSDKEFASKIFVVIELDKNKPIFKGYLHELYIPEYLTQSVNSAHKITFTFSISEEDFFETLGKDTKVQIENHAWQTGLPHGSGFHDNLYIDFALVNPGILKQETPEKLEPKVESTSVAVLENSLEDEKDSENEKKIEEEESRLESKEEESKKKLDEEPEPEPEPEPEIEPEEEKDKNVKTEEAEEKEDEDNEENTEKEVPEVEIEL